MVRWSNLFIISFIAFWHCFAHAAPSTFTYQGQIIKPNGQALEASSVSFVIEVVSPGAEECILYREGHTLNMSNSNGIFAIEVGTGTQSGSQYQDTTNLQTAMSNSTGTVNPDLCVMGGSYTPTLTDGRKLRVSFNDGSGLVTLDEDHNVVSVPYADSASSLDGLGAVDFIQVNSGPGFNLDQTNINFVFNDANWTELQALLDGSSSSFTAPAPSGDVDNNNQKIINLDNPDPNTDSDAVNVGYARSYIGGQQVNTTDIGALGAGQDGEVLTWDGTQWNSEVINDTSKLPLGGGTMTGPIDMGSQNLTNANNIAAGNDVSVGNDLTVAGGIGVSNGVSSDGNVLLNNERELQLLEATVNGNDYVSLKAPSNLASPVNLVLPGDNGDPGQFLQTDGSGLLSWQTVTAGVSSFNTRTGAVTAQASDYDANQIDFDNTYGGDVDSATEVQGAIQELSNEKVAKNGDSMTGNLVMDLNGGATTELRFMDTGTNYVGFRAPNTVTATSFVWTLPDDDGLAGQVLQTSGAGILSWTSMASESRTVTAGQGLTGGGDLSANRTFDIGAGNGIAVNADDIEVRAGNGISVDGTGVNVDIAGTADESIVEGADSLLIRDNSDASNLKEMTRANFVLSESEVDTFVSNNGYFEDGGNSSTGNLTLGNNNNFGLNFETNNSIAMTIDNIGNIGIGTTSPSQKLVIGDDLGVISGNNAAVIGASGTANTQLFMGNDDDNFGNFYWDGTNDDFHIRTKSAGTLNANQLVLDSSGNIGVGIPTPAAPLHVSESFDPAIGALDTGTLAVFSRSNTANADAFVSILSRSSGTSGVNFGSQAAEDTGFIHYTHTSGLDLGTAGASRVHIDASGLVGIGTSVPNRNLTVLNGGNDSAAIAIETPGTQSNQTAQIDLVSLSDSNILGTGATNKGWQIFTRGDSFSSANQRNDFGITLWDGSSWTDAFRIDSITGNIGVGVLNATSKLQVSGGLQIGDDAALCNGTKAGTLKYSGTSVSYCDGTSWEAFGTAAGGEVNTASNVGSGTGIFATKNTTDLEFKSLGAGSTKISISSTATDVTLDIAEANFDPSVIPVGTTTLTASNLEAALNELDSDKAENTRIIASGNGLTGGGDLSADRTLAVGAGNGITVNANDVAVTAGNGISVDGSGVHVDVTGTTAETSVNDADELLIYDTSATALRKMTRDNFVLSDSEVQTIVNAMGIGDILNGGNTEASDVTIGTNDAFNLNLETAGSTAMTISSSGNVGIGTTSPSGKLTVEGNTGALTLQRFGSSFGTGIIFRHGNGTSGAPAQSPSSSGAGRMVGYAYDDTGTYRPVAGINYNTQASITSTDWSGRMTFGTGNSDGSYSEKMRLTSEGNVGLGTTGPSTRLYVLDSRSQSQAVFDSESRHIGITNSATSSLIDYSQEGDLRFRSQNYANRGNNSGTTRMTITGSGDVGIGTTTPREALDINGKLTIGSATGGDAGIAYFSRGSDGNETVKLGYLNASEDNEFQFYHSGGDGYFTWHTNDSAVEEQMRLDNQGRLGIGTSSPSTALDVNGTVTATAFVGDGSGLTGIGGGSSNSGESSSNYVINTDSDGSTGDGGVLFQSNGSTVASVTESGSINANSGSTSLVGFGFQGDQDTGLFSPASNTVSLSAGGVEALRANSVASAVNYVEINPAVTGSGPQIAAAGADTNIDLNFSPKGSGNTVFTNGNVGIGTDSPISPMTVYGNNSNPQLRVYGNDDKRLNAFVKDGEGYIYAYEDSPVQTVPLHLGGSSTSPQLSITQVGNVGIGTTAPASKLEVAGTTTTTGLSINGGAVAGNTILASTNGRVSHSWNGGSSTMTLRNDNTNNNSSVSVLALDRSRFGVTSDIQSGFAGNMRMNLEGATNASTANAADLTWGWENNQTNDTTDRDSYVSLSTAQDDVLLEKFRITSSGNVGIGTTNPSAKLNVVVDSPVNPEDDQIELTTYADTIASGLVLRRAGNSLASPEPVPLGSYIGAMFTGAYDTTQFIPSGHIAIGTETEFTTNLVDQDTYYTLRLLNDGVVEEKMRVTSNGNVGFNTVPSADLDIESADSVGTTVEITSTAPGGRRYVLGSTGPTSTSGAAGNFTIFDRDSAAHRFLIAPGGDVGIGSTSPRSKLDVDGSISSAPAFAEAAGAIDFANSNFAFSASDCGAFDLHNMKDGATYTLAIQGTGVGTCNFSAYATGDTSAPLTVKYPPGHGATTSGAETLYSFVVIGSSVYVAWVPGYTP